MNAALDSAPVASDHWIEGETGILFARCWTPAALPAGQVPIMLLHDSLGSVELWRDFPAALCQATGRPVVAYDRLGFGRSAPHPGKLGLDFVSREAVDGFDCVRRTLAIDRFIVLGHSVGGGMAVHCAAHHGESCVGLITESAQAFVEARTVAGIEAARELFRDPEQVRRLGRYHGDKAAWVLDAWIGSWLHPDFRDWSLQPVLPQVHCPALVIHGIDDEYGSVAHPERIAAGCGGPVQPLLMADTRHVPHREKPAEVLAAIRDFVACLP